MSEAEEKLEKLKDCLKSYDSLAVAFSGGVDSTFLVRVAHDVLGDRMTAVTARSLSFPEREFAEAADFCAREGIRHLTVVSNELEIEGFRRNPADRCYICKKELFRKIIALAAENGTAYVAEGSNMDDTGDYRPGLAAIEELNVVSPLRQAGLYKKEIRELSRSLGLPTWDKPSFACLATRFVYGEEITEEKLRMTGRAEQLLLDLGFRQVRVRIHGTLARIEVDPKQFNLLMREDIRKTVSDSLRSFGFSYVTMDLTGYRTGSMNEVLKDTGQKTPQFTEKKYDRPGNS